MKNAIAIGISTFMVETNNLIERLSVACANAQNRRVNGKNLLHPRNASLFLEFQDAITEELETIVREEMEKEQADV